MAYRLGVDLGTTFTAAAVAEGSTATMVGLGDRALQVPSVLALQEDGTFLCGEAAERRARVEPDRAVREFKRRIGDTVPILVAGQPFSPQALSARLLSWVVGRTTERMGRAPDEVVLTHPANWGGFKRELFTQVAQLADLSNALTCSEPEAAATQYAARAELSSGDRLAVYDLGGGTFDVCVLEKGERGFTILGTPQGVEHLGGMDFDEAVFRHVLQQLGDAVADLDPDDPLVAGGLAVLRRECVEAKEALSSDVEARVPIGMPGLPASIRVTRREVEELIRPVLTETLAATRRALRSSETEPSDLAAVVLVGGSSRIPLVSEMVQSDLGAPIAMDTHPKHDVALGAARFLGQPTDSTSPGRPASPSVSPRPVPPPGAPPPAGPPPGALPGAPPPAGPPSVGPPAAQAPSPSPSPSPSEPARESTDRRRRLAVAAGAAVVLVAVAGGVVLATTGGDPTDDTPSDDAATSASQEPATSSPSPSSSAWLDRHVVVVTGRNEDSRLLLAPADAPDDADAVEVLYDPDGEAVDLPAVGPDRSFLTFQRIPEGGGRSDGDIAVLSEPGGAPSPFLDPAPTEDLNCRGRPAWLPEGRMALLCQRNEGSPDQSRLVLTAPVDAGPPLDGTALEPVPGLEALSLRDLSATSSGGLVIKEGDPGREGIHFYPDLQGVAENDVRLTSAAQDLTAVANPREDLVAFERDGEIYLVAPEGGALPEGCVPVGRDPGADRELCRITDPADPWTDDKPAWSADGRRLTLLRSADPDVDGVPHVLDLADPADVAPLQPGLGAASASVAWAPR